MDKFGLSVAEVQVVNHGPAIAAKVVGEPLVSGLDKPDGDEFSNGPLDGPDAATELFGDLGLFAPYVSAVAVCMICEQQQNAEGRRRYEIERQLGRPDERFEAHDHDA